MSGDKPGPGCTAFFRRGFVAHVSMTVADFLRHAPALSRPPLEGVTLADREPLLQGGLWWWEESNYGNDEMPRGLPTEIFAPLYDAARPGWRRDLPGILPRPNVIRFPSRDAALAALSAACVAHLRTSRPGLSGPVPPT